MMPTMVDMERFPSHAGPIFVHLKFAFSNGEINVFCVPLFETMQN